MLPNRRDYSHMRDAAFNIRADSDDEYEHSDNDSGDDEAWRMLMEANYNVGDSDDHSPTDESVYDDEDQSWQVQADALPSGSESDDVEEQEHVPWQYQPTKFDSQRRHFDDPPSPLPPRLQCRPEYSLEERKPRMALEDEPESGSLDNIISYCDMIVDKSNIRAAIVKVERYLGKGQTREAELEAQKARDLADKYEERRVIARCKYWQARVKFAQGNYDKARRLFHDCQLWITEYPEASTMAFYLPLCEPGLNDQDRRRMLQDAHRRANQMPPVGEVPKHRDSKRNWEDSLHLLSQDIIPQSVSRRRIARPKSLLDRQPEDPSGLKLGGREKLFTFEVHPTGMAPRFRPTDIFSAQPYEVIVPQEQWEDFIDYHRDQSVTLSYLERERRRYQTVVNERYNQR
ncbi:hypothetical protein ASPBRDRAFT_48355 [Aspergillus brasiliensis CBS 101740]|uniref:Uncharacterized protein n=1 Tax=Aspergillus brasiliensis (strain CBS 101740 / IMI 381727 / IBT 21946) TaxID=767769 RepID=A0A1L9U5E3_ASPBC|nr:hypothetical protein ASPBRDRAFT_48355 [Aspergillus brasiliensis CBS 101740]